MLSTQIINIIAIEIYNLMSVKRFTYTPPMSFNGGTQRPQLSSC